MSDLVFSDVKGIYRPLHQRVPETIPTRRYGYSLVIEEHAVGWVRDGEWVSLLPEDALDFCRVAAEDWLLARGFCVGHNTPHRGMRGFVVFPHAEDEAAISCDDCIHHALAAACMAVAAVQVPD